MSELPVVDLPVVDLPVVELPVVELPVVELPVVELNDVFVVYPSAVFGRVSGGNSGGVAALRGLSLGIHAGERLVVRGPSGSGKSTLVKVVTGAVSPSAGEVRSQHESMQMLVESGRIAVLSQGSGCELLPELSCLDNVALTSQLQGVTRKVALSMARESLVRCGVEQLAQRMPATLSTGEAQRVAISAALRPDAVLVVADEPAGALDRAAAAGIYALLDSFVSESGAGLLLVSHDPLAEAIADRVATIRDGRVERLLFRSDVRSDCRSDSPLVVDSRGWVRVPESMRRFDRTVASEVDGGVLLSAVGSTAVGSTAVGSSVAAPFSIRAAQQPGPVEGSLSGRVEQVRVSIDSVDVVRPVSCDFSAGQITVFSGPSGAGKTTLLSVITGLRTPTEGTVSWSRKPVAISFAPSSPGFAESATVQANLKPAPQVEIVRVLTALAVDHLIDRRVETLSGGERQRVGVARAILASGPGVVIALDEPTSQLDERNAALVATALQQCAAEGALVLLATHDDQLLTIAHDVVSLG